MTRISTTDDLAIAESDIGFSASRSAGPGGQNVNKVATRVTLTFDVEGSEALTGEQKIRIRQRQASRISG